MLERTAPRALPDEVSRAITRTEERSEILISLFQAGFVAFMGILYFLAPKGYTGDVPVRPVPLVLMVYSPFVAIRLALALTRRLTPLLLNVSIIVDVAMICVLLWTFHVQYQQDPGFYLKAPTAFYLFLFVALRSLRYDARYVLFAGATAAAGWIALTVIALRTGSDITRDFVSYITGTDVLVGAQVDRIIAILVLTLVLAVGVRRNSGLLVESATESRARTELSRYFSPRVVTRILESGRALRPGEGEIRDATVLTVDLRGFTSWAQREDPDVVMSTLADYQRRVLAVVLRHSGSIDKFLGDGVLCHFGAADDSQTSAADALRCAEELREELIEWSGELEAERGSGFGFGIGVADGRLVFGTVGSSERLEFTAIGTPVNTCAKLEKHTKALGAHILVPFATYERALGQGFAPRAAFRRHEGVAVEGIDGPLDLAVVTREPAG